MTLVIQMTFCYPVVCRNLLKSKKKKDYEHISSIFVFTRLNIHKSVQDCVQHQEVKIINCKIHDPMGYINYFIFAPVNFVLKAKYMPILYNEKESESTGDSIVYIMKINYYFLMHMVTYQIRKIWPKDKESWY